MLVTAALKKEASDCVHRVGRIGRHLCALHRVQPPFPLSNWLALQGVPRERLEAAVQAFARDRKAGGGTIPATVPLRDLVIRGYLGNDIRGLAGEEAIVSGLRGPNSST